MLSMLQHGRVCSSLHLVQSELKQCSSFQLRNLRVPYFQPDDSSPLLDNSKQAQDRCIHQQTRALASSLAFDPSSGDSVLTSVQNQAAAGPTSQTIPTFGSTRLELDPSSHSNPLESDNNASTSGSNDAFTPRTEDTKLVSSMLRADLVAEMTAVGLFKGRRLVTPGNTPDLDFFKDQEKGHLQQLQSLMPSYRARPSLLGPVAAAAGLSLGAAAGLLPTKLSHAITGEFSMLFMNRHLQSNRAVDFSGLHAQAV